MARIVFLFASLLLIVFLPQLSVAQSPREHLLMDFGWRFAFGHATDTERDFRHGTSYFSYLAKAGFGDGPAARDFDDRSWRVLNIPHDWAVELPFDSTAGFSHGYRPLGKKFPHNTIGWYRKKFVIPEEDKGKRLLLQFDGLFQKAKVWINGFYLGEEESGYYGFSYDITDYVSYGGINVLAVRVDATMEEGWYYEGAGIYRHVWLIKTSPVHIPLYGVYVQTKVSDAITTIFINTSLANEGSKETTLALEHEIRDAENKVISRFRAAQRKIAAWQQDTFCDSVTLQNLRRWSPDDPYLYTVTTRIIADTLVVDDYTTTFGIRTLYFDAETGFYLNGKHLLLKGTNNHQDHAGIGVALPDRMHEFRIRKLKEMGANAYRCAHHPPAPELLDACDKLGMLVIDENRLFGVSSEHFRLVERMIQRDRNHPSVILWSIGNEEWAVEGNETGARLASSLQRFVKNLDSTRYVTYANSGGWGKGISTVQEVMGYNYIFNGNIDEHHAAFPNQPSVGTEESTSMGARGIYFDNPAAGHLAQIDRTSERLSIEKGLRFYAERPFLSGLFFWTGFDYRGECQPYGWPQVTTQYGILDLCGFPKDMFYYLKAHWTDEPVLHVFPHWNWKKGDTVRIWVYTNCDEVELSVNGKSYGKKQIQKYSHGEWILPFEEGALIARGYKEGKSIIKTAHETTDKPVQIRLYSDRLQLFADREDVAVITAEILDKKGRRVPVASDELTFLVEGPARIIGVGNGNPSSHEPERFIDSIAQVFITGLSATYLQPTEDPLDVRFDFQQHHWQPLVDAQGNYALPSGDGRSRVVIRGIFSLPAITEKDTVVFYPKVLCEEEDIFINGHCVVRGIRRDDKPGGYFLSRDILVPGENIYTVVGSPQVPRYRYDNLNTEPGIIQVKKAAAPWKRKAFQGLAQLLIQTTERAGQIIVKAFSPQLRTGELKIQSVASPLRKSVGELP